MPSYSSLSPITQLPLPTEISQYNSKRESNSLLQLWKNIRDIAERVNILSVNQSNINQAISSVNNNVSVDYGLFPFCIYQLPDMFYGIVSGSAANPETNWLTVRVRGGYVLNNVISTGSYVNGTDNFQQIAYDNYYPQYSSSYDIILPVSQSQWWFWIENTTGSYYLRNSPNPTSASLPNNPNAWSSFPTADSSHIPVGYCDTMSSASINQTLVRQFLTSDVLLSGGGTSFPNFRGYFNSAITYNYMDWVMLGQGSSQGVYFSTIPNNLNNLPSSGVGWVSPTSYNNWL